MTKTHKKRIIKNKTLKITLNKKNKFIKDLLKEWKKQTNGTNTLDKSEEHYIGDYYLTIQKNDSYNNHIHLILRNFNKNHNSYNNIIYVMKKIDKEKQQIIHSKAVKINILSNPDKVVINMIKNFNKFNDS
jgi:hypothetical protein